MSKYVETTAGSVALEYLGYDAMDAGYEVFIDYGDSEGEIVQSVFIGDQEWFNVNYASELDDYLEYRGRM